MEKIKMSGFVRSQTDTLYKAYYHGTDWQIIGSDGSERWYSVWGHDRIGSLYNALQKAANMPHNYITVIK